MTIARRGVPTPNIIKEFNENTYFLFSNSITGLVDFSSVFLSFTGVRSFISLSYLSVITRLNIRSNGIITIPKLYLKSDSMTEIEKPIRAANNIFNECVINIPIFNRFFIRLLTKFKIKRTWRQKEMINTTRIMIVPSRDKANKNIPRKKLATSKNDKINHIRYLLVIKVFIVFSYV